MISTGLKNTTAMMMGSDLDTVGRNCIENELHNHKSLGRGMDRILFYLIVFRSELVQTFLNDVISVQVRDEHNKMEVQGNNNRVERIEYQPVLLPVSVIREISFRLSRVEDSRRAKCRKMRKWREDRSSCRTSSLSRAELLQQCPR